jgi:hypothetical protein
MKILKAWLIAILVISFTATSARPAAGMARRAEDVPSTALITPQPRWPGRAIGSGAHAVVVPAWQDHLLWQALYAGSGLFALLGMGDAARQMRHYLDNDGAPIVIDVDRMLDDMPAWRAEVDHEIAQYAETISRTLHEEAARRPMTHARVLRFDDAGWRGSYATRDRSLDWYFAVGGFAYTFTAIAVVPARDEPAHVYLQVHVYDRYDWDRGRATSLGPVTIDNESIGRLHAAGLAREYEVMGRSRPITFDIAQDDRAASAY